MDDNAKQALLAGLAAYPAELPPKLFYDKLGSILFTAICEVPEYYPTRTEAGILASCAASVATRLPGRFRLVDLGAGDCRKAASLFPVLKPTAYTPIDISGEFLLPVAADLQREHPDIAVDALVRDFTNDWSMPAALLEEPLAFFYPGSSIGNFSLPEARRFLIRLTGMSAGAHLLIGIDLVKDADRLEAAYDDAIGVTAAFNRNVLLQVNRLLGCDFELSGWDHRSVFNRDLSRIEMHLVSRGAQTVRWPGGERTFRDGETIHTESSYKYTPESFAALLTDSGFEVAEQYLDDDKAFMVVLARATAD